jgi:hypothetical protein
MYYVYSTYAQLYLFLAPSLTHSHSLSIPPFSHLLSRSSSLSLSNVHVRLLRVYGCVYGVYLLKAERPRQEQGLGGGGGGAAARAAEASSDGRHQFLKLSMLYLKLSLQYLICRHVYYIDRDKEMET